MPSAQRAWGRGGYIIEGEQNSRPHRFAAHFYATAGYERPGPGHAPLFRVPMPPAPRITSSSTAIGLADSQPTLKGSPLCKCKRGAPQTALWGHSTPQGLTLGLIFATSFPIMES